MKTLIALVLIAGLSPLMAQAIPQTLVNRPIGNPKGLVVIAPAKKYLMQERLFEGLAQSLSKQGLLVVRFNWDSQTLSDSALELQRAAEDMKKVIAESQKYFKAGPQQTVLISKSFSTKALGPSLSLAKAHVILTPNCSAEAPFLVMYGAILQNRNFKTSIFISSEDPNCDVRQIHQSLIQIRNPPSIYLSHGDHNFVMPTQNVAVRTPQNIYLYQDAIIQMVTVQVLTEFSIQ
jgi:hypothetical protein